MSEGGIKAKVTLNEAREFLRGWIGINEAIDSQLPSEELYDYLDRNRFEGTKEDAGAFCTILEVAMAIPESDFAIFVLEFIESLFSYRILNNFEIECRGQIRAMVQSSKREDFDYLTFVVSGSLKKSLHVSEELRLWAAGVLDGSISRPRMSGTDRKTNALRDYNLSRLSLLLNLYFGLPLYTNNELSTQLMAAEVVSKEFKINVETVKNAIKKFNRLEKTGVKISRKVDKIPGGLRSLGVNSSSNTTPGSEEF